MQVDAQGRDPSHGLAGGRVLHDTLCVHVLCAVAMCFHVNHTVRPKPDNPKPDIPTQHHIGGGSGTCPYSVALEGLHATRKGHGGGQGEALRHCNHHQREGGHQKIKGPFRQPAKRDPAVFDAPTGWDCGGGTRVNNSALSQNIWVSFQQ